VLVVYTYVHSRQLWIYTEISILTQLLAHRPNPKLKYHPLSAVRYCLFNTFAATLHIGDRSSIRNLRTRHAVVTGTQLSRHPVAIFKKNQFSHVVRVGGIHDFLQRWNKTFRRHGGYNTNNDAYSKAVVNFGHIFKSKARIALKKIMKFCPTAYQYFGSTIFKKCFTQHHDYLLCYIEVSNHYYLLFCTSLYNSLHKFLLRICILQLCQISISSLRASLLIYIRNFQMPNFTKWTSFLTFDFVTLHSLYIAWILTSFFIPISFPPGLPVASTLKLNFPIFYLCTLHFYNVKILLPTNAHLVHLLVK
jgi:hypothetical protein